MPIYAYRCSACGRAKDVLQKMSDPVLTDCPFCGESTFVKQLTAAGFQLKGSGWYVTDFRGDSKAPKAADGTAAEGGKAPEPKPADGKAGEGKPGGDSAAGAAPAPAPAPAKGDSGGRAAAASPAPSSPSPAAGGSTGPASK